MRKIIVDSGINNYYRCSKINVTLNILFIFIYLDMTDRHRHGPQKRVVVPRGKRRELRMLRGSRVYFRY